MLTDQISQSNTIIIINIVENLHGKVKKSNFDGMLHT